MKTIVKAGTESEPSALELANRKLAEEAAVEGFVLLKNEGALPLEASRVALYGSGARRTVKGGTGSGAVRERYSVSIEQGLEAAGVEIATKGWLDRFDKYYEDSYEAYSRDVEKKVEGIREFYKILGLAGRFEHPTGIPVTQEDISSSQTDTAIYVIGRQAGEGEDREDKPGDYRLDGMERENLRIVSEGYPRFIVILNMGGFIDLSFLEEIRVDALVYFSQGGEEGGNALAGTLTGKRNFSGKLAASWPVSFGDIPSNSTYSYLGKDKYQQEYNEGIYMGYRYFDTFGVRPRYAFGYGLSYTTFRTQLLEAGQKGELLTFRVLAANTGARPGNEVVQLYASVPFGRLGSEYQRLTAFARTGELQPGETEELLMEVSVRQLTVYDEGQSAWLLQAGEYIFRLGNASDAAEAVWKAEVRSETVLEYCRPVCPAAQRVEEILPPRREAEPYGGLAGMVLDTGAFKVLRHSYEVPGVSADAGLKELTESMTAEQLAALVCGGGTHTENMVVQAMGASGTTTAQLYEELGIPNIILSDGPAGLNLTSQIVELPDGIYKAAKVPHVLEAYRRYLFGFAGTAMKSRMAEPEDGVVHYQYASAWPCSQLLAQSFDTRLLERVGAAVGAEMEVFGITVWLAPGMNLQRNPLCGRNFEYYSEDPLVSGKMAAALVRGVQSHMGKAACIKHFAANNCELERNLSSSNMSERTLRELYLKGFEIAVKEGNPLTVMASYNLVNGLHVVNNYDLLCRVLRNEWGFEGLVMSDWDSMKADREDCTKAVTGDVQKAPHAQCDLIMPGRPDQTEALLKGIESGAVSIEDLRRSACRILQLIRQNTVCEWK